jgi:SDR family mycofactocin-dependent oxidoreductase
MGISDEQIMGSLVLVVWRRALGGVMALQFEGKVAFITGAARGQGRSHAIRFAEEGADIIAFDLCDQIDTVAYPMATREGLDETVNLVEKTGRRIVAEQGDVRDFDRLKTVVANGVAELGRLDFVLANAGIMPGLGEQRHEVEAYVDAVDVLLNGVYYTVEAALPALLDHGDGGAIVITSSAAGLNSMCPKFSVRSHGFAGYHAAKHGVVGLMRYFATSLAEKNIRVNTVHPCGVATPMILNEAVARNMVDNPEGNSALENLLPVPMIESIDVTEAMIYLCGQSGRYITGVALPVDAGFTVK